MQTIAAYIGAALAETPVLRLLSVAEARQVRSLDGTRSSVTCTASASVVRDEVGIKRGREPNRVGQRDDR